MKNESVVVGDWSDDGHGKTERFMIEVPDDVDTQKALKAAKGIFSFKMDDFCEDYDDGEIPSEIVRKIIAEANFRGVTTRGIHFEEDDLQEGNVYICADDFFALWLAYLNVGVDALYGPCNFVGKTDSAIEHEIGGYGLFS